MSEELPVKKLMEMAIDEQNKCVTYPKIGVVISKDGKVLSSAFRHEVPGKHAERIAIEKLDLSDLEDATIFTTLEPCVEFHGSQSEISCAELIEKLQIKEVVIGVLDPNGKIYCQGYDRLLKSNIKVSFFDADLRETVEANTFKFGDCSKGYGPGGKRRVAVVASGKKFSIQFSHKDISTINFRWSSLQYPHGIVDLIAENDSVRCAIGARNFEDISDPSVFREPSHFARMKVGHIATICPKKSSFSVLIKLIEMTDKDIVFQWQVRKI